MLTGPPEPVSRGEAMKRINDVLAFVLQTAFWTFVLNALLWVLIFQPVNLAGFRYVGF